MFRYFIMKSIKSFVRQKLFFYLNLIGFSAGLACTILLFLFVRDEYLYDRFHEKGDRIYRLILKGSQSGQDIEASIHSFLLQPLIQEKIPEIENSVQLLNMSDNVFSIDGKILTVPGIFTTPDFFKLFSFDLIIGNPEKSLNDPRQIFVSESLAKRFFGTTEVAGRTLKYNKETDVNIAGVFRDVPAHSHLQFDFILSLSTIPLEWKNSWGSAGANIYLIPGKNADIKILAEKIRQVFDANKTAGVFDLKFRLQPLKSIYLGSTQISWDIIKKGDINTVMGFIFMSILILVISVFNYLNLKMARYFDKAKDIGIRKTLGAGTMQLSIQFYAETIIFVAVSVLIALIITESSLPWFNTLTDKKLHVDFIGPDSILFYILVIHVMVFLVVAVFPSLYLSKFKPVLNLNKYYQEYTLFGKTNHLFKTGRVFVFTQYIISILFAISSITIYRQMKLVTREKLGYNKEHVIILNNPPDDNPLNRYRLLRDRLNSESYIYKISAASDVPTQVINNHTMAHLPESPASKIHSGIVGVDFGYFGLLETEILSGRDFDSNITSDSNGVCIINKSLADRLGIENIEDHPIINLFGDNKYKLLGIVDDMQFTSLREPIKPTAYVIQNWGLTNIILKIHGENLFGIEDGLGKIWQEIAPVWPLEMSFLDENVNKIYQSESRSLKLFSVFTVVAILLSTIGVYGLSAYSIRNRIREIGIRKVFGADIKTILKLLSSSYIKIVAFSFILSAPLAMIIMSYWLKSFVFKVGITWWTLALPGSVILLITLFSISWNVIKTAIRNPVEALRYE